MVFCARVVKVDTSFRVSVPSMVRTENEFQLLSCSHTPCNYVPVPYAIKH